MTKEFPSILKTPESSARNDAERSEWQEANRSFWESNPMRYDWSARIAHSEFSMEFFREIDDRFFRGVREFLPWKRQPFEDLMHLGELGNRDVLEIGVGNGSHAQLLAASARTYTGIDITSYAIESTTKRLKLHDLRGSITQMDAEKMEFSDESFDFVWSWGVVHHSSSTHDVMRQIARVLRPGGQATIMVYHRGWWNYYFTGFLFWLFRNGIFSGKSLHEAIQSNTDGAIARYYTPSSWREMLAGQLEIIRCYPIGPKSDLLPIPAGWLKEGLKSMLPSQLNRILTRNLSMGGMLICEMRKT